MSPFMIIAQILRRSGLNLGPDLPGLSFTCVTVASILLNVTEDLLTFLRAGACPPTIFCVEQENLAET